MTTLQRIFFIVILCTAAYAQNSVDYFIRTAEQNSPQLKEYSNQIALSNLQLELIHSQNDLPLMYLSAGFVFAPYFNNNGKLISVNPDPKAIGYDVGLSNGGFYSAQLNLEKNIFNGALSGSLKDQQSILERSAQNNFDLAKRELIKQVTEQYLQAYQSLKLYELDRETALTLNEQLAIIKRLAESGTVKQSLFLLLSIEYENQNIAANDSYLRFRTDLTQLCTICGISVTAIVSLDSVALSVNQNVTYSDYLRKFDLDSLALNNQQQILETKYEPQVSVFVNTGINAVEIDNIQRKFGVSAGINFSLPLYDGGQRSITEQQQQLSIETVRNYKINFGIQLSNQRKNSLDRLENLRKNSEKVAHQLINYGQVIDMSEKELQHGQLSMVEYLTILKNYIELRKNKISVDADIQREINTVNYWNQ